MVIAGAKIVSLAPYQLQESQGVPLHPYVIEQDVLRTVSIRNAYLQHVQKFLKVVIRVLIRIAAFAVKTPIRGAHPGGIDLERINAVEELEILTYLRNEIGGPVAPGFPSQLELLPFDVGKEPPQVLQVLRFWTERGGGLK